MPQQQSSDHSPKVDNSKQQKSKPAAKTQPMPIPNPTATIKNHSKRTSKKSSSEEKDLFDQGDQKGEKDPNRPALAPFIVESRPGLGQNPDRRDRQIIERPFPNAESHARLVFPPDFSKEKEAKQVSGEKSDPLPSGKAKAVAFTGGIVDKDNPITTAGNTVDKETPVQSSEPVKGTGEELAGPSVPKKSKPKPKPTPKTKPQSTPSAARADEATSSDGRVTDAQIGEMEDWLVASENPIWPMKEKGKGEEKGKEREREKEEGKKEEEEEEEKKKEKGDEKGEEREKEKKKGTEKEKEKEKEKGKGKGKEKEKGKKKEKEKKKEKGKGKGKGKEKEKEKEEDRR